MKFLDAVALLKAKPAGPDALAVSRPRRFSYVFADVPLPDGRQAIRAVPRAYGRDSESFSAVLYVQDVEADDWEVIDPDDYKVTK